MTLIIGVKCEDGVVMGADSAATLGALGTLTVSQQTDTKIHIVSGKALIGVSGPVGLGQRLTNEFDKAVKSNQRLKGSGPEVMHELRLAFEPILQVEFRAAQMSQPVVGPQVAASPALSSTLAAMVVKGKPTLFEFDQQGAPEEATAQIPFMTVGSGKALADPLMGFIRGIFWAHGDLPTVPQAEFAVLWSLIEAIRLSPGGISEPVFMYRIRGNGQKYVARELEPSELQEHRQMIESARGALRSFNDLGSDDATDDVPA